MILNLNQSNQIIIDPSQGSKIQSLTLKGKTIIKSIQKQAQLAFGSYLMFPWVNRVISNPYHHIIQNKFNDGKGYPLHGLYVNTKRQVKTQQMQQNNKSLLKIHITNSQINQNIHNFAQAFTLSENTLEIQFNVIQSKQDQNVYCFGYHPYFELSKPICELKIKTNLNKQLQLEEDLLVKWPHKQKQWNQQIDGKLKYDSLFQASNKYSENQLNNYVELDDGINNIKVQSNLQYWQIYTPDNGKRIAIEPMSFHGNIYQIEKQSPAIKQTLPKSGKIRISII